ncbi:hypothetical protein LIER_29148 [Lithospermum erythrorhizon]|uniref:Uncharacterized protein n=1 Tax=Lithospermum erythrorhizon TaxID=34254 RepID=A0AAV3RI92_LITER
MEITIISSQPYPHPRIHIPPMISYPKSQTTSKLFSLTSSFSKNQESIEEETKKKNHIEIRVCTNRTCRKQGSLDTLLVVSGIAPPNVSVTSCGCLGRCGSGPNVVVLPEAVLFNHCGTPYKAASLMLSALKASGEYEYQDCVDDQLIKNCLEGLALRKRAEDEISRGDFSIAFSLLSQAIDIDAFGGLHVIYKDRSAASLAMGDLPKALEDANAALELAPEYSEAYICLADALMAMDQIDGAEESYSIALTLNPSLRRSDIKASGETRDQEYGLIFFNWTNYSCGNQGCSYSDSQALLYWT